MLSVVNSCYYEINIFDYNAYKILETNNKQADVYKIHTNTVIIQYFSYDRGFFFFRNGSNYFSNNLIQYTVSELISNYLTTIRIT